MGDTSRVPGKAAGSLNWGFKLPAAGAGSSSGPLVLNSYGNQEEHTAEYWAQLGEDHNRQRRYADAETAFRRALAVDPKFTSAHVGLGFTHYCQGRNTEAEAAYREALRLDPAHVAAHLGLGIVFMKQGRDAEAEVVYHGALRLDLTASHAAIAHNGLGIALFGQRRHTEAESAHRAALRLDSASFDAHYGLGSALARQDRNTDAEAAYRDALLIEPTDVSSHHGLGNALQRQGRNTEAEAAYRDALRLDPTFVFAHRGVGDVLASLGRYTEAEAAYRDALGLDPEFVSAHYGLGNALNSQDRHAEAEAAYQNALRLDPEFAHAYCGLGNALADQGRHTEAESAYRDALRVNPEYASAYNGLGDALVRQDLHTEARAAYIEALRLDPTLAMSHANLGQTYTLTNRPCHALCSHARAVRLTLGQPDYLTGYVSALQAVERTGPLALVSALATGGAFDGVLDVALEMGRGDLGTALGMAASRTFGRWVPPGRPFVESLLLDVMRSLDEDSEQLDADAALCADAPSSAQPPAALQVLADARESLVWASLDSDERRHWLNLFDGLGARAARLCLRAGQPGLAAEHLERSLAIDLTQSAFVKLVDLQRFVDEATDSAQRQRRLTLKARYEEALKAWEAARYTPEPGGSVESQWLRIRQARLGIYLALLAIRQEDSGFGEPTRWPAIAKLSHARALVYLGADAQGGLGVLVHQGVAHPIPGLEAASDERLKELIAPLETLYEQRVGLARLADGPHSGAEAPARRTPGWLGRLFGGPNKTQATGTTPDDGPWNVALDEALRGLWELVMAPVVTEARRLGIESLTLIPSGPLAMLPLQLAWREAVDGTTTAGRRYALQDLCIAFTPSAGLLARGYDREAAQPETSLSLAVAPRVLAILDDTILDEQASIGSTSGRAAPSYADRITAELHRIWGEAHVQVLRGAMATPQAVFEALDAQPDIVYFFGHGTAAGSLGDSSSLRLASGQTISLEEVLRHTHRQSLWVVLACEAARGKRDIPRDEAVSFAGGLLQAGVGAVVAATVPIAQHLVVPLSLKLLAHHAQGMSPAQALRRAQQEVLEGPEAFANAHAQARVPHRKTPQPARVPTLGMGFSVAAVQGGVEPSSHLQRPGHWALQCFGG
jgi:tetratricopeptide (TPR) repeat protein/CHAT domain-containing protein